MTTTRKAKTVRKPKTVKPKTEEKTNMSQVQESEIARPENFGDAPGKRAGGFYSDDPKPKKSAARRERIPLGTVRQKLTAPSSPGKVRRWVNDNGSRVQMAEQGGYDFVEDTGLKIGETAIGSGNQDLGSRISRIVGTKEDGSPLRAYLMEIDEDLYNEDQAAKAERVKEVDDQIRHGNIERKPDDGRYVPTNGITYKP